MPRTTWLDGLDSAPADAKPVLLSCLDADGDGRLAAPDPGVPAGVEIALDPARRPLFIHCARGKDRTGMMAGLYRIEAQGWEPVAAVEEMRFFGYHGWYHDLIDYVRRYVPRGYRAPVAQRDSTAVQGEAR